MKSVCVRAAHCQPSWHDQFLAMLPSIQSYARRAFRRVNALDREEAVQAVVALAMVAYARLVQRQQAHRGSATPLARYAVKQYRSGRLVGGPVNCRDVGSQSCQRRGCVVESLDQWQAALCDSRRSSPADLAALRIDLGDWLSRLTPRNRRVAGALASGEPTGRVAKMFRLTAGRVSQIRRELADSWWQFVGEEPAAT